MKREVITLSIIVAFIAGIIAGAIVGSALKRNPGYTSDTITITNTITVDKPVVKDSVVIKYKYTKVPIVRDSVHTDTMLVHDSVEVAVPISQKHYADSTYEAWVSGFMPQLDSIKLQNQIKQITIREKPKRWGVGVQAGVGVTPKNIQPYIGIGITYNLINF